MTSAATEVKLTHVFPVPGKDLCLEDHMKEVEKYSSTSSRRSTSTTKACRRYSGGRSRSPRGYTLLTVRRARNSMHVWEAEYEKTEILPDSVAAEGGRQCQRRRCG